VCDPADFGKKHRRFGLPIEQKKSHKWIKSYQTVLEAQKHCPDTLLVRVGDREADIHELFETAGRDARVPKLLVRPERDRVLVDGQEHLWDHIAQTPRSDIQTLRVPRRVNQPARDARLEVLFLS